jgi:Sodium/hydrogen exchanger family
LAGRAAGIALALLAASPMSIPLITDLPASPFLEVVADFGIFFLLLFAGLEMRPREIAARSMGSLAVALGGVLVPLAAGFGLGPHHLVHRRPSLHVARRPFFGAVSSTGPPAAELEPDPVGEAATARAAAGTPEHRQGPPGRWTVWSVRSQE